MPLPTKFLAEPHHGLDELIEWTYGDLAKRTKEITKTTLDFFASRCIVAPTNEAANEVNEKILASNFESYEEFLSCGSIQG